MQRIAKSFEPVGGPYSLLPSTRAFLIAPPAPLRIFFHAGARNMPFGRRNPRRSARVTFCRDEDWGPPLDKFPFGGIDRAKSPDSDRPVSETVDLAPDSVPSWGRRTVAQDCRAITRTLFSQ